MLPTAVLKRRAERVAEISNSIFDNSPNIPENIQISTTADKRTLDSNVQGPLPMRRNYSGR